MARRSRRATETEPASAETADAEGDAGKLVLEIATLAPRPAPASPEVATAAVVGVDEQGRPLLRGPTWPAPQPARTVVPIGLAEIGRMAVVAFEGGDAMRPLVLGLLQPEPPGVATRADGLSAARLQVECDGERVELTAQREIVLKCGKASITLTRAGKILIRGAYVSSRSTGVNRIFGGSVEIN